MPRLDRPDVAFVLSGDAILGAIQADMLGDLYERGITPDLIVGTSAGAMNGAFIASRPQTVATADALAAVQRDLKRWQVFPLNPLTGLLGFLGARDHLVPAFGLRKLIAVHLEHEALEDLPISLHVVTVDAVSGEELCLSRGPIMDAVLASVAIPGVVAPVRWEDRTVMDGGGAKTRRSPTLSSSARAGVYVLPTGHACPCTNRRAARSPSHCTRSACSPNAA